MTFRSIVAAVLSALAFSAFATPQSHTGALQLDDLMVTRNGFNARWHLHDTAAPNGPGIASVDIEGARRDLN